MSAKINNMKQKILEILKRYEIEDGNLGFDNIPSYSYEDLADEILKLIDIKSN